jgi:hypothetical protein
MYLIECHNIAANVGVKHQSINQCIWVEVNEAPTGKYIIPYEKIFIYIIAF